MVTIQPSDRADAVPRRNDEVDAGIQSDILNIISDMPSYGYRRVQVTGHTGAVADG